jgi:uncharacterized protein (TIGR02996 family)
MHDEDGFLSAIRQTPADDTARLVFADWLDEQDDPTCKTKADFIRLELRMAAAPEQSLNRIRWLQQLQKLAAAIDPAWLALISHPKLEACRVTFRFECPRQWERLTPTDAANVRFCESCKSNVHYCDTLQDARNHAVQGDCVALSIALVRRPNDLNSPRPLGVLRLPPEFIRRLSTAGTPIAEPLHPLPPPSSAPEWVPAPEGDHIPRTTRHRRNKRRRQRNRNIQRENWEEAE